MGLPLSCMECIRPNDNVLDEKTGLTVKQKRMIRDSWKLTSKNSIASGTAIMKSYFEKYPKYQNEFSSFRGIKLNELSENKKFQAHCYGIITTLSSAIDSLDDIDLMEAILVVTGERHGRRGQTYQAFHDLKSVIIEFLESQLGHKFTPELAHAWDKTLDFAIAKIFHGMRLKYS